MSTFRKVESSNKTIAVIDEIEYFRRRKSTMNRPIPTLASNSICECSNGLGVLESRWLTVWLTIFGLLQNCSSIRENSPAIA
jgi:hypothetical protein